MNLNEHTDHVVHELLQQALTLMEEAVKLCPICGPIPNGYYECELHLGFMAFIEQARQKRTVNLVLRAVLAAKSKLCGAAPRWVAVGDTFDLGSTTARELCRYYGLDPYEHVTGVRCLACEP